MDPDYNSKRPLSDAKQLSHILASPSRGWVGLDYGGGEGKLSKWLRDNGFNYDSYDPYGSGNSINDQNNKTYNFCSMFEVAEHSPDPIKTFEDVLSLLHPSKFILLVGTHVNDKINMSEGIKSWWYAAPRNGHVSLYSKKALSLLAYKLNMSYVSISEVTHIFYRGYFLPHVVWIILSGKLRQKIATPWSV